MRAIGRGLKQFYVKAYTDNLTGLAGMVAYSLLLSIFPVALIALFVAGQVLVLAASSTQSVVEDLQRLFPSALPRSTLLDGLRRGGQDSSTTVGHPRRRRRDLWFATSFWGSLDTAFCRIYHRVVPLLGAPEAVRARDARRRPAVLRRQREHPRAPGPPPRAAAPICRSGSARSAGLVYVLSPGRRPRGPVRRPRRGVPPRANRPSAGSACGRARSGRPSRWSASTTASCSTSRTSRPSAASDVAPVRPDRPPVGLRPGPDHPRRRGRQRARASAPPGRYARPDANPTTEGCASTSPPGAQGARSRRAAPDEPEAAA